MNFIKNRLRQNKFFTRIADLYPFLIPIKKLFFLDFFLIRKFLNKKNFLENIVKHGNIMYNEKIQNCYASLNDEQIPHPVLQYFEGLSQYALQLKDVQIIGGSHVVILDKKHVLYDYNFLKDGNIKFTDNGIMYYTRQYCCIDKKFAEIKIESGITLVGNFSYNYCHLLIEIISKFQILQELKIDKNIPIILDKICLDQRLYKELISFFNTEKRQIIYVEPREIYNVKNLIYLSSPNFIAPDFKNLLNPQISFALFNFSNLHFIKKMLLLHSIPGVIKKKIFISRQSFSNRRPYNDFDVQKCLEKYGFECYFPENHSIAEQIFVFQNAEIIIGASGAGLTNLLFCNSSCTVICLTSYPMIYSPFFTIAAFAGLKIYTLYDKNFILSKQTNIQSGFSISIVELENTLKKLNN